MDKTAPDAEPGEPKPEKPEPALVTSAKAGKATADQDGAARQPDDDTDDTERATAPPAMVTWKEEDGWHARPNAALQAKFEAVNERNEGLADRGFESPEVARRKIEFALAAMIEVVTSARWVKLDAPPNEDD